MRVCQHEQLHTTRPGTNHCVCPIDLPGPPSAPEVVEAFRDSCTLTWKEPDHDGGTPVTGYFVERSTAKSVSFIRITRQPVTETTYTVQDLLENNEYRFRIVAANKVGEGQPGPPSRNVQAKDPWGKLEGSRQDTKISINRVFFVGEPFL